jgi:hypothetical protein
VACYCSPTTEHNSKWPFGISVRRVCHSFVGAAIRSPISQQSAVASDLRAPIQQLIYRRGFHSVGPAIRTWSYAANFASNTHKSIAGGDFIMMVLDADESQLLAKAEAACQRMAPLWPLKNFVASNPYLGLTSQSFWKVHETLERITGTGLCMPRAYYIDQIQQNRITHDDLAAALIEFGGLSDVTSFERDLAQDSPSLSTPFPLVTDILGALDSQDWSGFVVERISRYCAAYFDEGQALLPLPWKNISLYKGWLQFTYFDKSPRMLGIRGMRKAIAEWPDTAKEAIVLALRELNVPPEAVDDYLYAALLSIGGWAGWTRYLRWQA